MNDKMSFNENLLKNDIKVSEIKNLPEEETIDVLVKKVTSEYEEKIKIINEAYSGSFTLISR